jgi:tRNA threonylcarbamoyladenosine biosynthesis protein TsaE
LSFLNIGAFCWLKHNIARFVCEPHPDRNSPQNRVIRAALRKPFAIPDVCFPDLLYNVSMPIFDPNMVEFLSRGPEQTRRLGARLGTLLEPGDVICLAGDLGAGKTTLVQGLAQGWGSLDAVSSPTFVLVNVYRRPDGQNLHHLDAYRLQDALEAEALDLDQMLDDGALVVEWPDRIQLALPREHLWVGLAWVADEQRRMTFKPVGTHYEQMLAVFRQRSFGG